MFFDYIQFGPLKVDTGNPWVDAVLVIIVALVLYAGFRIIKNAIPDRTRPDA